MGSGLHQQLVEHAGLHQLVERAGHAWFDQQHVELAFVEAIAVVGLDKA